MTSTRIVRVFRFTTAFIEVSTATEFPYHARMTYLALLRGINVGGNNIRMTELKACFEGVGFSDVATYIQSGNVVFSAAKEDPERLALKIEKVLQARFGFPVKVAVLSQAELRQTVDGAPKGFGRSPAKFRYDVLFLKRPYTSKEAMRHVTLREGVDAAAAGKRALYFSRLIARATQSRLSKILATPAYAHMTIRNWNTTTKLLAMMEGRG